MKICLSTGIGYEANPIMRAVVDNPILIILVKGIALGLIIIVINCYKTKWIGYFGMSIVIGITLGAVINNLLLGSDRLTVDQPRERLVISGGW